MKPGDSKNLPVCVIPLHQRTIRKHGSRKSKKLNLNVSDESLVDKYISVFLVND